MSHKIFTSQSGWFSLTLPIDWEEYDDGEEDTYAFFNAKNWTGNFRITPFRWADTQDPNEDKAANYIANELSENKKAIRIKLGSFDCAYYKEDLKQEEDALVNYYWVTGMKENLFICSFTIDKKMDLTQENKAEMEVVQDIIKSIQINPSI